MSLYIDYFFLTLNLSKFLPNLKSKAVERDDDESAVNAASFPLAQSEAGVEHVVLKQDALAHPG